MKLTNAIRQAFVSAVLADVPMQSYDKLLAALIQKDALSQLPAQIQEVEKDAELKQYLSKKYYWLRASDSEGFDGYFSTSIDVIGGSSEYKESESIQAQKREYINAHLVQEKMLKEFRYKLEQAINAVATVKQAKELMPQFSQYLPIEATTAIFSSLAGDLKALGFPKIALSS